MKKLNKTLQFGEDVEGYNIPVLNEREIRATAGILFLMMFTSIMIVIFEDNYLVLKYARGVLEPGVACAFLSARSTRPAARRALTVR